MGEEVKIGSLYKYKFDSFEETPEPFAVMEFVPKTPKNASEQLHMIYNEFKKQTPFLLVDKWSDKKYDYYKILFGNRFVELGLTKPRKWKSSFAEIG